MAKQNRPWQKNFRRTPETISRKVARLRNPDLVVACTKQVAQSDIEAGLFAPLGIAWKDGQLRYPESPAIPKAEAGKYSTRNIEGREIVREDLPMETRTFTVEAPNFGDWSRGSHEISWDREVYQRQYEAPRHLDISVELLEEETPNGERVFLFKFRIGAVLRKGSEEFEDELLYALNLLQENVGAVGVFAADATRDDYLKTVYVAWEILPPGERDTTIARVLSHLKEPSDETKKLLLERYNLLSSLKPLGFIEGTSGFQRYFGAKFADNLVAFENLEYGNAVYVMFGDWEALSKLSRLELLKGDRTKFLRVVHSKGWKAQLKSVIDDKRAA